MQHHCDLTMAQATACVAEFHARIDATIAGTPRLLPGDGPALASFAERLSTLSADLRTAGVDQGNVALQRASFAVEELAEWLAAHARSNLVEAADALADRLYVLLGDAVATGLPLADLFLEVHRSNMTKTGKMTASDGRGLKGGDFVRPDVSSVLRRSATKPLASLEAS